MEDVLEVYHRPYEPRYPLVCFDEGSKQHIKETRLPLPARPGHVAKYDYEYERNGTSNLFIFFAPLENWRHIKVTEQRTKIDFAHCLQELVDTHFPEAEKIILVMDNLNTHHLSSLYEAFPAPEARRIMEKLEIHYTPKHGSWLNMAEIELSVLHRQCLKARLPNRDTLMKKVADWENHRNQLKATVRWRFTTQDARIKLHHLYPTIDIC
jgi:transposase